MYIRSLRLRSLMSKLLIFTDMDGTLLDHHTYSHAAADSLLTSLEAKSIPVIPCTSKTYAELVAIREELNNKHPFIVENGAAIYIPQGYLPDQPEGTTGRGEFWVKSFVAEREHWIGLLNQLPESLKTCFTSFTELGVAGVVQATGLSMSQAELSSQRQYGEPVLWAGTDAQLQQFTEIMTGAGANILVGGRFVHVSGLADKGKALVWLQEECARQHDTSVVTCALGDSGNDVAMLAAANYPVIIKSPVAGPPNVAATGAHRRAIKLSEGYGPEGWAAEVNQLLAELGL
jgi:mannosyl-3-phosphoglycerate phosphatase